MFYSILVLVTASVVRDVMVILSALVSSAVDRGFCPGGIKPKTINMVFAASPLGTYD